MGTGAEHCAMVKAPATKACAVEPLRQGQSVGAAMALLGVQDCVPLLHGAQGCATVAATVLNRHFRRNLPLRSVGMNEISTALGGRQEVVRALQRIERSHAPRLIGVVSGSVAEASGGDLDAVLDQLRCDSATTDVLAVSAPEFCGSLQDGWSAAISAMIRRFVDPGPTIPNQVVVLPGSHLTPGDIEELKSLFSSFGLASVVLPDLSDALAGRARLTRNIGSVSLDEIRTMLGRSAFAVAIGEQMRGPAETLRAVAGIQFKLFASLTGLGPSDELIELLRRLSGNSASAAVRRQRDQLVDAMIDCHSIFAGLRVALAGEADLVFAMALWLKEMGADPSAAILSARSPVLAQIPVRRYLVGDLDDLRRIAVDSDLIMAPSSASLIAANLALPLWRCGLPITDRWDGPSRTNIGYRGTKSLLFDVAALTEGRHDSKPGTKLG